MVTAQKINYNLLTFGLVLSSLTMALLFWSFIIVLFYNQDKN